jgi:hypothetical protein
MTDCMRFCIGHTSPMMNKANASGANTDAAKESAETTATAPIGSSMGQ